LRTVHGNNGDFVISAIFAMNADGSGLKKLTRDTAYARDPAWSPDGTKIAFDQVPGGTGLRPFEIFVMRADGSNVTRLTRNLPFQGCGGSSRGFETAPAWSPNGTRIAFLHKTNCFGRDIDVMNANGTGITRLTNAGLAQRLGWGPSGKIVFDPSSLPGEGGDREIDVVTVSGAVVTQLTSNAARDEFPTWSPDGTKIAFESDRDGDFEIYAMNANGSGVTKLTHNSVFDGEPAWTH
jgi:Tol biopolymer transport system component